MNELRSLVTKHADSISNYYIKYVLDYDFVLLAELVQEGVFRSVMNENDLAIIYSCLDSLGKGICVYISLCLNRHIKLPKTTWICEQYVWIGFVSRPIQVYIDQLLNFKTTCNSHSQ